MLLVTSTFLYLAGFCYVVWKSSIIMAFQKKLYSVFIQLLIVQKYSECHLCLSYCNSPVTVGVRFGIVESSKYRLEYISEHTFYFGCIFCIPSVSIFICCICISHDFCCVYQHKSLKAGTKRIVRTFYFL